ncbi:MAG TPA: hypothetical protein VGN52_25615 [Burkholderiales bacterium]
MKASHTLVAGALALFAVAAQAAQPAAPTRAAMTAALKQYLAKRGDLCIGRYDWPIDVPVAEFAEATRDTLQLPTMENAGLLSSSTLTVERAEGEDDAKQVKQVEVRRYELTPEGRKFYLKRQMVSGGPGGTPVQHAGDFCAGQLTLDKVVSWQKPVQKDSHEETTVSYTYHINAYSWARDEDLQGVFPMVERVVNGDRKLELQQRMRRVGSQWVAVQIWEK